MSSRTHPTLSSSSKSGGKSKSKSGNDPDYDDSDPDPRRFCRRLHIHFEGRATSRADLTVVDLLTRVCTICDHYALDRFELVKSPLGTLGYRSVVLEILKVFECLMPVNGSSLYKLSLTEPVGKCEARSEEGACKDFGKWMAQNERALIKKTLYGQEDVTDGHEIRIQRAVWIEVV